MSSKHLLVSILVVLVACTAKVETPLQQPENSPPLLSSQIIPPVTTAEQAVQATKEVSQVMQNLTQTADELEKLTQELDEMSR